MEADFHTEKAQTRSAGTGRDVPLHLGLHLDLAR
jgi:hypothetical protein